MRSDQEKRLIRLLMISGVIILILVSGILSYVFVELSGVKREQINLAKLFSGIELKEPKNGIDGRDGESIVGPRGPQGPAGKDSISTNTTVIKEVPIKGDTGPQGPQGEKGDKGDTGADGKTVFTRQDVLTGEYECRYAGDDEWQPESECS